MVAQTGRPSPAPLSIARPKAPPPQGSAGRAVSRGLRDPALPGSRPRRRETAWSPDLTSGVQPLGSGRSFEDRNRLGGIRGRLATPSPLPPPTPRHERFEMEEKVL